MSNIYTDIGTERARQDAKWGSQRHLPWGEWSMILGEEYGEACQEMLNNRFGGNKHLSELREELIQVAAVSVAIIEAVDVMIDRARED
jgi:hypothetical protein